MRYSIEGDAIPMFSKICVFCTHLHAGERTCSAFPDEIPIEIWMGENPHNQPYPGDHGIQFEEIRKSALAEAS